MNIRYKYPTIPRRDAVIENLMTKISESNKDIIDLLLDCNTWYLESHEEALISSEQLKTISVYMYHKSQKMRNWAKEEIDEYNRQNTTRSNKDSEIDRVFGYFR